MKRSIGLHAGILYRSGYGYGPVSSIILATGTAYHSVMQIVTLWLLMKSLSPVRLKMDSNFLRSKNFVVE